MNISAKAPRLATPRHTHHGLVLPHSTLKALRKQGIYCTFGVSLEHQHLAGRYVLRGGESGAAVFDMGRACAFIGEDGSPLPWLQSLHAITVNGRNAIFLAESIVRLEMLRAVRIYELAITHHTLLRLARYKRPQIASKLVFRGLDGVLPFDLWKEQYTGLRGRLTPVICDRAGEVLPIPERFDDSIRIVTTVVCCLGC